jgi:hypothetical protein
MKSGSQPMLIDRRLRDNWAALAGETFRDSISSGSPSTTDTTDCKLQVKILSVI